MVYFFRFFCVFLFIIIIIFFLFRVAAGDAGSAGGAGAGRPRDVRAREGGVLGGAAPEAVLPHPLPPLCGHGAHQINTSNNASNKFHA